MAKPGMTDSVIMDSTISGPWMPDISLESESAGFSASAIIVRQSGLGSGAATCGYSPIDRDIGASTQQGRFRLHR
jgi:hypothetical protein